MDGPNARLAELSGAGRVIRVSGLPRHLLPQAEGITFGVDGTLYLASEGHYGLGVLAGWSKGVQASIIGCRHTVTASTPGPGRWHESRAR